MLRKWETRLSVVIILLLFTTLCYSQTDKENSKSAKGKEIINQARQAIDKNDIIKNLKTFYLKKESDIAGDVYFADEISIELPNKIRTANTLGPSKNTNIWSGSEYSGFNELSVEGKVYVIKHSEAKIIKSQAKGATKGAIEDLDKLRKQTQGEKSDEQIKREIRNDYLWLNVFPMLLNNPLDSEARFEYIGKAESPDKERADVVDVKADYHRNLRLFFDENNHSLLMMIVETDTPTGKSTQRYFFSNYELTDSVKMPKRIIIKSISSVADEKNEKNSSASETLIKEVKINPEFKSDFFNKVD